MKHLLLLLSIAILTACGVPNPATPSVTPVVAPSATPSIVPSVAPTLNPSAVAPTIESTRAPAQSAAEVLLPVAEKTIDLGPADIDSLLSARSMVLDDQADRLYVSLSPSRTVVLDANTLTPVGEIPLGGALSVNPNARRLYIGVPGEYGYNPDGTSVITPAELKLFDTSNLALVRSSVISATNVWPPLVEVDPTTNKVYLVQGGVYIVDATTLDLLGTLTGTFPDESGSLFSAVDAAILPQQQRLFVSLDNGIPGSNNGNVLGVYDLATEQLLAQDLERSVSGFAVDETTGEVVAPRSRPVTAALVKYDAQGHMLKRLDGSIGIPLIDPAHDRIYVCQWDDSLQVKVFDRDLNFLGVVPYPEITVPQAVLFDPKRDRVLVLRHDGQLSVLKGQGGSIELAADAPVPDRKVLEAIIPSPQIDTDQTLFALFAPEDYAAPQGSVFRSNDAGATWQLVAGLPVGMANDLKFADQLLFTVAGGNGVEDGYGIWRSADGGQTWQPAAHGLADLSVTRLVVSPDFARDGTLYALSQRGVFRSTDRGATWTSLADRYAPLLKDLTVSFSALAVSPNFARDNTVLIGHSSGQWRSTDRGETWTKIEGGPPATRLTYTPNGSIVFAVNYDGVQRSTDGGLTWQLFNDGLDLGNSGVAEVQTNDREAVVLMTGFGQPSAVYRLPLNATTWQRVPIEADVTAMALTAEGQLLVGTSAGTVQRVE